MNEDRRQFIKRSACTLGMAALATQARHFGMMSAMAAPAVPADYRALVCILLNGGNDGNNMMVPNHSDATVSNYAVYASSRAAQGMAVAQNDLLPVAVPRLNGLVYGFHPSLGPVPQHGGVNNGLHELWAAGKLAVVANTGTLIRPLTKAQYLQMPELRPYLLFSHSDQVTQQQTSRSDVATPVGWAGKIADLTNAGSNPSAQVPMISSIAGMHVFTIGRQTTPLVVKDARTPLNETLRLSSACCTGAYNDARNAAMAGLRTIDLDSALVAAASKVMDQGQAASTALGSYQEVTVPFPNNPLGHQLKQVARLIKKRADLNVNRQVFFVQLGGFDSHQNQLQGGFSQASLLAQVSQAMRAFHDEMEVQGLQDKVTQFTLSDFGRTMVPAGIGATVGTDHGWGSHMLVLGGAVNGGNIYGSTRPDGSGSYFPNLALGGPDDVDAGSSPRGRWLPTTGVEQYAGTLARWFGVAETDLPAVFPNIANFSNTDLGFMSA